ncbi:MAG: hypothetical protein AAF787_00110 [Chloroflexota bacterium]
MLNETIAPERVALVKAFKGCQDGYDRLMAGHDVRASLIHDCYMDYVAEAKTVGEGYFSYYSVVIGHGVPADYPEIPIEPHALPQLDDGTYYLSTEPPTGE